MFHQGDLQSGIALALHDSKLVICFVRDTTTKSRSWEEKYLKHANVAQPLQDKAVLLRIEVDSQEASFLSAFCPIAKAPMIVVIKNGQLQEIINAETTRDDLLSRLAAALEDKCTHGIPSNDQAPTCHAGASESEISTLDNPPLARPEAPQAPHLANTSTAVQDVLSDRRNRLEGERKSREAAEKAERIAKAKIRRAEAEAESAISLSGSSEKKEPSYAEQQRKRQRDARQERERILKLVENGKAERKEKEERRKAQAREENIGTKSNTVAFNGAQSATLKAVSGGSVGPKQCAIQVRLLDGSTIKTRFPVSGALRTDVRRWVDDHRIDGDLPYTFKQILIPLPNRSITISEEEQDLLSLGLAPSATLVMTPVLEYTNAYGNSGGGLLSRGVSTGYGALSMGTGLVTGALRPLLGLLGRTAPTQEPGQSPTPPSMQPPQKESNNETHRSGTSSIKVRTLQDQQGLHDDQQFYNGNQLNFEPRPKDSDKND